MNRRNIGFTLLFGIGCALIGPLGTFVSMGFWERLSLWCLSGGLALLVIGFLSQLISSGFPAMTRVKQDLWVAFGFSMFFPVFINQLAKTSLWTPNAQLLNYFEIQMVIICVVVTIGVGLWLIDHGADKEELPRLYARLCDNNSASVVRLTVRDHYTEVFTSDGKSHRLLMRFADAVSEMDDADGFLTHRSHWVMASEIKSAGRCGNREFLVLREGTEIPISKTYRPCVVAAGFL